MAINIKVSFLRAGDLVKGSSSGGLEVSMKGFGIRGRCMELGR